MFYGTSQYDPIYIIAQIASIQAIFYIVLGALFWVLVGRLEDIARVSCHVQQPTLTDVSPRRPLCWQAHSVISLQQHMADSWRLDGAVGKLGHSCCHCHLYCPHCKTHPSGLTSLLVRAILLPAVMTRQAVMKCRLKEPRSAWTSHSQFTSSMLWLAYHMLASHAAGNGKAA